PAHARQFDPRAHPRAPALEKRTPRAAARANRDIAQTPLVLPSGVPLSLLQWLLYFAAATSLNIPIEIFMLTDRVKDHDVALVVNLIAEQPLIVLSLELLHPQPPERRSLPIAS